MSSTSYSFAGLTPEADHDSYHSHEFNHPVNALPGDEHAHPWDDWDFEGYKYVVNICRDVVKKPERCEKKPQAPGRPGGWTMESASGPECNRVDVLNVFFNLRTQCTN